MALRPRPSFDRPHSVEELFETAPDRPSKSAVKRACEAAQTLGEELVLLSREQLARIPLTDALKDALEEWQRTRSFEGRRRQLQFIGKLMRKTDTAPLQQALDDIRMGSAQATLALHETERWRAELIASDDALTEWMRLHPQTDPQHLRSLVRSARKDAAATPEARNARAYRELFQFIKAAMHPSAIARDAQPEVHSQNDETLD
jgi:ribosome-associated protein